MAIVKKTYAKKKVYRKKPNIRRMIKSEVLRSQETKETTYSSTGIGGISFSSVSYGSSSASCGLFGAIVQGTAASNRIGDRIYARGVNIRLALQAGDPYNNLRFIVFRAKTGTVIQPGLTGTFVQSLLSGVGSSGTQWLQPVDTDRFVVYYDKTFNLKFMPLDGSTGTSIPQTKFFNKFIKVNRPMQWDRSGSMNDDVYMVAISDSAGVPNPGAIAGFVRVYFKDA